VPVVARVFPLLGEYARMRAYNPLRTPRSWPTPANRRAAAAREEIRSVCDELIAARRADGAGDDLIGLLIAARDGDERLDDSEIRDQVLIFLLAGHDTTAIALTFALHLLGQHPEEQERVRAEAAAVGGRTPGAADVEQLAYTPRWCSRRRCGCTRPRGASAAATRPTTRSAGTACRAVPTSSSARG
jgi:cytochrome P450